jgi:hypothetical protein
MKGGLHEEDEQMSLVLSGRLLYLLESLFKRTYKELRHLIAISLTAMALDLRSNLMPRERPSSWAFLPSL